MKRKRIKKRYIVIAVVAAVVTLVILKKNQPIDYLEHVVETGRVSDELRLAGTIDAARRADLSFAASGRVEKVLVAEGDSVTKGQILAELSQNRTYADLTQARANLTRVNLDTQNEINDTERSYDVIEQEQNLLVARAYQEYLSGDLVVYNQDDQPRSIQSPVITGSYQGATEGVYDLSVYSSSADSGYSYRLTGLEEGTYTALTSQPNDLGTKGLYIQFIDGQNYKNTEWRIEIPNRRSASFSARKLAYESALATRERVLEVARSSRDRAGAESITGVTRSAALNAEAKSRVNAAAAQINDGRILAPFDGVLAKNFLEVGEVANAFDLAMVVLSGEERILTLNTPEIYINKINLGSDVSIDIDAYRGEGFSGKISNIDLLSTEVDGVPVYRTEVLLTEDDPRIRVGMNAQASIVAEEKNDTLRIPAHYVIDEMVKRQVEDTDVETVSVELGLKGNDGFVEILSGLSIGDIILSEKE